MNKFIKLIKKFYRNPAIEVTEELEQAMSDSDSDIAIEFKNVNFGYIPEKQIIKNVSFEIKKGKYVCIVGHNGSGKSTISKILMGLVKPWNGDVKILGVPLISENLKAILNNMGLIFQNPDNQFIGLTAQDDIAFGLENRKVPREVIDRIIYEVANFVDINDLLKKDAASLSGGQKQKVAIASILAINPRIIIFDESTSMLDPKSKKEIKEIMKQLSKDQNKTVISITHDMEELLNADEILVIKNGELIKHGTPEEIFTNRDFLLNSRLDFPFINSLSYELQNLNLNVPLTYKLEEISSSLMKIKKEQK